MTRRALAGAAALLVLAPPVAASAAPAAPTPPPGATASFALSAVPSPESRKGWFVLPARPGDVLQQAVRLTNLTSRPTTVLLSAADAGTGPQGGVTYADGDAPARGDGRWVTPQARRVVLPARAVRDVAVQVRVPEQARSGSHLAGLVARSEVTDVRTEQVDGGSAAVLEVHVRQVLAVEVRLPGDARADIAPTAVRHEERASGPVLVLDGHNRGNGLGTARGSVRLSGPTSLELPVALDTTVPRTAFSGSLPLPRALAPGRYTALAVLRDADGRARELRTGFEVAGGTAEAAPQRVVAPLPLGAPPPDEVALPPRPRAVDPLPAHLLALGGLATALLLAGVALLGAVRGRRHARQTAHEALAPASAPPLAPVAPLADPVWSLPV